VKKILALLAFIFILLGVSFYKENSGTKSLDVLSSNTKPSYWLVLHRKSNVEFLYYGEFGQKDKSILVKTFNVKTGIPGQSPTPLPRLLGKEYWLITSKEDSSENPETAPYFLTLDIPVNDDYPFGPSSYNECNGQCDWQLPGYFGMHGINGDEQKLSNEDPGSSGCIRHKDQDIVYLYNLLDPKYEEIRYYIEDI
jgi:lipoprotein-anchoring transpeptidase ErfK/SrfK